MSENNNFEIKRTATKGIGMFALKEFKKGEQIYMFPAGRIVNGKDIGNLSKEEKSHLDKIGNDAYEIISSPACYVNHSCEPNVEEKDRRGYAFRDILKGEELTVDYMAVGSKGESFSCLCGSGKCRKIIQ